MPEKKKKTKEKEKRREKEGGKERKKKDRLHLAVRNSKRKFPRVVNYTRARTTGVQ